MLNKKYDRKIRKNDRHEKETLGALSDEIIEDMFAVEVLRTYLETI